MRDRSRDGLMNRLESFLLTNFKPLWRLVQKVRPLRRWLNRFLINRAVNKAPPRPNPLSTFAPYTSWRSLTDRTYSGRHLPPAPRDPGELPATDDVLALFRHRNGQWIESEKSSLLFSYFAQWFTDGFLRTDRDDRRRNTSNHDIDLSPLYGLKPEETALVRSMAGGRLKSQQINGEEYPPYYYENGTVKPEFANLPIVHPKTLETGLRDRLFAMGGDRANVHIGYTIMNTLFLREHNRICGELHRSYPLWDDERLFQTARNILIVVLIKLVIQEYINHIAPYHFKFTMDPTAIGSPRWYRTNWMTVEFNLLYRWHSLTPPQILYDGQPIPTGRTTYNTELITSRGLGPLIDETSLQSAGRIGLHNTWDFLIEKAERPSVEMGRMMHLASYNDYRELVQFPRVTDFDQITGDPHVQQELRQLYGSVDEIEFFVGLFAEETRPHSALPALMGRMVGIDAFSQALTNPLLAKRIFNAQTFSPRGMEIIEQTNSLSEIVHRNVPTAGKTYAVSLTRHDWRR